MSSFPIDEALARVARAVAHARPPVVDLVAVQTRDPYKVLVATILSARTRDETTAKAAARLFAQAPDLARLDRLGPETIARLIRPVGFANTKAKHLAALPGAIQQLFGGRIPDTVEELVRLPGVGRKTANLVVTVAFGKPAICVDTHVHRITNIWGYVATKTPLATEMRLREILPRRHWLTVNSLLVSFGQTICRPVRPHCDACPLAADICPQTGVTPRRPPRRQPQAPQGEEPLLRLVSWNVNGLRAAGKKGFCESIAALDADIVAVQEIKAFPDQLPKELREAPGYIAFWEPARRKGYSGVAVYSRIQPVDVRHGMGIDEFDTEGRVLTLEFGDFFLVNAYFPNAQHGLGRLDYKLAFNAAFQRFVKELRRNKTVVVCGDFNVAHKEIDLARPKENEGNPGFTAEERAWMDGFLADGWRDTFRLYNKGPGHYTWWSYRAGARAKNIGWRIDYFCIDDNSRHRLRGAAIHPEIMGSDHCPISLELAAAPGQGRGYGS